MSYNDKKFDKSKDDKWESELIELYQQYIQKQVQKVFKQSKLIGQTSEEKHQGDAMP